MPEESNRNMPERESEGFGPHVREIIREQIRQRARIDTPSQMDGVQRKDIPLSKRNLLWRFQRVDLREISGFTRELAILLRVGTPILQALRNIGERTTNTRLRECIYRTGVMVENGHPFWEALNQFSHLFSPLYVSTVRTGEYSGNLDEVLERLADYTEQMSHTSRRLLGILAYPALVVVVAIIICTVLSTIVVPVFRDMFETLEGEVPPLTKAITQAVAWLSVNWYWVIIGVIGVGVVYKLARLLFPVRLLADRLKLWLPVVGPLLRKIIAARFARSFAMLYRSGVPVVEALSISRGTVNNEVAALHIDQMRESVETGYSLEKGMRGGRIFPSMLADMVAVGEQSGDLNEVLRQVADVYEEEANISLNSLGTLVEPVLILIIGALVLTVFAGFFLPYIELLRAASSGF